MADIDYDDYGSGLSHGHGAAGRGQSMMNIAGALTSVALVLGLGFWGYKIAVRDVNGIPVLRAMGEPMRVTPADPEGESAAHQGFSVNAVASVGAVADLPEQLVLAPAPVELAEEDAPGMGSLVSGEASELVMAEELPDAASDPEAAQGGLGLLAPVEIAAVEAPMLSDEQSDAVALALADALGTEEGGAITPDEGQIVMVASPRPRSRPGADAALAAEGMTEVSAPAVTEINPSDIAAGTRLVQLGAFDDRASAEEEWARIARRFADIMADKAMVVQEAKSGGRTFYRLRAHGFGGDDDARRFCAAILAEGASCIPVTQR